MLSSPLVKKMQTAITKPIRNLVHPTNVHLTVKALDDVNVLYIGSIGTHHSECLVKYGISYRLPQRFKVHMKNFSTFDPLFIVAYDRNRQVEKCFGKKMRELKTNRTMSIGLRTHREIVASTSSLSLSCIKDILLESVERDSLLTGNLPYRVFDIVENKKDLS